MMQFTPKQQDAIERAILALNTRGGRPLTIGGYAGTGKTTIIREITQRVDAAVCAYTGKAVDVLRQKGIHAQTLHSLMYTPEDRPGGEVEFHLVDDLPARAVIVDEASMLPADLYADLRSFGTPLVLVGDMGQLEPIGDDPRLMASPDIVLDEIHRQALESEIIQLAEHVRSGADPVEWGGGRGDGEVALRRKSAIARRPEIVMDADMIICGFNRTRVSLNAVVREYRGFKDTLPLPGDRLICLRNDREHGLYNGMPATVLERLAERPLRLLIQTDGGREQKVSPVAQQFGKERTDCGRLRPGQSLWDYGYALTAHKAQGSEAGTVAVYDEGLPPKWDSARWRYTAITRARKSLVYVTNG